MDEHICTVCNGPSWLHPERCPSCDLESWPPPCCENCDCRSFEKAHADALTLALTPESKGRPDVRS